MTILEEIFTSKRLEVAEKRKNISMEQMQSLAERVSPAKDFVAALRSAPIKPALIAEIKRASPSRDLITTDFDPIRLANIYQENGATAISVLTDNPYFMGDLDFLSVLAQQESRIPLLRKDFICDPYQVYESRVAGADALLLIVASLSHELIFELHQLTQDLGMTALVEVHSLHELDLALHLNPNLIGINNRNLHDFSVDLETTPRLRAQIPSEICVVGESGVHSSEDVLRMAEAGVDAILVGESLVSAQDIAKQVRDLVRAGSNESKNMRSNQIR